jgi:Flp pilus assembly protein CpaB
MSQLGSSNPGPPPTPGRSSDQKANIPLILVAIALGLVAVLATNWYVHRVKTAVEENVVTIWKVNVSRDAGDRLREDDVSAVQVPATQVAEDSIQNNDIERWFDQDFRQAVSSGEFVKWAHFYGEDDGGVTQVTVGRRGKTIPVAPETAPPMLQPGHRVDLSANLEIAGSRPQNYPVMESVRVVGVGNRTLATEDAGRSSYRTITVDVEPKDAELLETIRQYAEGEEFVITLRNPNDREREHEGVNPDVINDLRLSATASN